MNRERAWETLLSRLREARHPACARLRAARLLPSENGVFRVALASADDLNALAGTERGLAAVLEAIVDRSVCVIFHAPDGIDAPNDSNETGKTTLSTTGGAPEIPTPQTSSTESEPSASDAAHAAGAAGTRRGYLDFNLALHRERIGALAKRSATAAEVLSYLMACVCTHDGWTWGLSQRRLGDELGTRHHRIGEALDILAEAGILIDRRKDERNGYLTRFRLDGYSYVPGEIGTATVPEWYRQGTNLVSASEIGTATVPPLNLVVVDLLRRLSPETLIEILRTLGRQQQQDSGSVPPGYQSSEIGTATVPISGAGAEPAPIGSVPPGYQSSEIGTATVPISGRSLPRLDPAALDPDRRLAHHWLAGYRIVGPTLLELLGADPERVIGLLLEIERDRRDGQVADAHATGRLVTLLREDAQPWALTRRFVRHVRETGEAPGVGEIDLLDPDFGALLDDMLRGLRLFAHYDPARYTSGEYADYIES